MEPGKKMPLILTAILLFLLSCNKSKNEDTGGGSGTGKGAVKPVGTLLEAPKTVVVGPEGGSISSNDGKVVINIPAGALSQSTTIGIAEMTSTSDAAIGNSYEFTPHMNFAKPVTITFSYADYIDSIGGGCGPGIGFQDPAGVWQLKTKRILNEVNKTVSTETTHFSCWVVISPFRMTPSHAIIHPEEQVEFEVRGWVRMPAGSRDLCSIFSEGSSLDHVAVDEYITLPTHAMDWINLADKTEGAGKLIVQPKSGLYIASDYDMPEVNPTMIPVYFHPEAPAYLSKVEVRSLNLGVFITLGNTTYTYEDAHAFRDDEFTSVVWKKNAGGPSFHGSMGWTNPGRGTKNWSDDNQFLWEPEHPNPFVAYQSYWDDGKKVSSGDIKVTQSGNIGQIVEGTFTITNAGKYKVSTEENDLEYLGITPVTGRFRVLREE